MLTTRPYRNWWNQPGGRSASLGVVNFTPDARIFRTPALGVNYNFTPPIGGWADAADDPRMTPAGDTPTAIRPQVIAG